MTGFVQVIEDVKTLVKTDRRIWLALGFLTTCGLVYFATQSWRVPYVEEEPVVWKRVRIPQTHFQDKILKLNQAVENSREERRELRTRLHRAANEIEATQKEIDWQVDRLIDSLDSMSSKVDNIVNKVGSQLVQQQKIERMGQKNKKRR